jgi:hypothetical protein
MDDFKKGVVSGIAQTLSGHPFDTIKVYKQNNLNFKFNIYQMYKGILFPLISNTFIVGSQFYIYHNYSSILAGFISGLMITPIDYFKTQKQINKDYKYKLTIPKGLNITITREVFAVPIYFNSYYYINNKINNPFISGGISGILSWLIPYPIDTIKSRIQSGISLKKSLKMKNYYKGLNFCLFRAFLVNGIGFFCLEKINI